jgi:ribosome-binding protein aMBF1 (putative translation factor)
MEKCVRCNVDGGEVRLFDAIYEGRMSKICERCSIIENVPIIKKPDVSQLKESEKGLGVYDRMKRLSGIKDVKEGKTFFREDKLSELDKKPELELPEKEQLKLVEHFYWEIMQNRRRKGFSQKQLSEAISESEIAIEMIEKGKLPENAEILIKKLEQFFQIRLRKPSSEELMKIEIEKEQPVLLDEYGRPLENIPEPEIKEIEVEDEELEPEAELKPEELEEELKRVELEEDLDEFEEIEEEPPKLDETGSLDIHKTDIEKVTIGDLRSLHKQKIEVTRQEKIEEQKKIEERQRLIEARKEELRLMREKESSELDNILGGVELLDENESKLIEDSDIIEEFEEELV